MTAPIRSGRQSTGRIFTWPLVIGVASVTGLLAALVGDGTYDALSWVLLGGVVALIARQLLN
jgi:hypothetical protein